jgi:ubiquinone/menaquinone biosynthesis C-methylase UbiE
MTADPILERYRRLDDFLAKLKGDIYPETPSALHTQITQDMWRRVAEMHPQPPGAKVLDVGCGQGVALEVFKAAGLDPVGITLGPDAEACRAKGLNVVEMDLAFLEFEDASFDLVWCRHALEHSVFPFFTLAEMHRVLKPGGLLYVEVPAPDTSCRHQTNPNHYSVLGKSMWIELIRRVGFKDVTSLDINFTSGMGPDTYWAFIQKKPG